MKSEEIQIIMGMAFVTFGIRYLLFAVQDRLKMLPIIKNSLKFIPPAVLAAITVPIVLMPRGYLDISWSNPYLFASILAIIAGIASKNLLITIFLGISGFFLFQWLFL